VPGGTFNRDGNASYPATISGFRLDQFDVTVGRFRAFINAGSSAWSPAVGSGIHTHLNGGQGLVNSGTGGGYETGWQAGWTSASLGSTVLATTAAQWTTNLDCGSTYQTWQPTTGNETLPINCVDWYEAYAFCIWDGGFLPSEAEFNYAFMGGSAENTYPWGNTAPGANASLVVYGGSYNGPGNFNGIAPVGSVPAGNGVWGQSDLAGEMWQWNLDLYENPYSAASCSNCADTTDTYDSGRVIRGGGFSSAAPALLASYRNYFGPTARGNDRGFRCARTP
jgi:formylglycine-generating enzyme required for sulfatase activity